MYEYNSTFCQVCRDAGECQNVYNSHNVRTKMDRYGKYAILCPTLLSRGCRYCNSRGHVGRHCPTIEKYIMDRRVHKIECDIESSEEEEEQEVVDAVVEEMTQSKFIETSNSELDKSQSEINIRKTWAVRDFNRDSVLIKYEGYNKNLLQLTAI